MALSLAGMMAEGETEIDTAESIDITFPGYVEKMSQVGARMRLVK
jgi:3-phosphoshikimate 1-carboxyvinyltransferase